MARASVAVGSAGVAFAVLLLCPGVGNAGLGRVSRTVEDDRAAMRAVSAATVRTGYTVHALTLPNGGAVSEFERPDGMIFAVTWRGPGRPDLRQLLGDAFDAVRQDNAPGGRRMRRPLRVERSDVLVQSGGHPGAFWGAAILPRLEPAGFTPGDLQ